MESIFWEQLFQVINCKPGKFLSGRCAASSKKCHRHTAHIVTYAVAPHCREMRITSLHIAALHCTMWHKQFCTRTVPCFTESALFCQILKNKEFKRQTSFVRKETCFPAPPLLLFVSPFEEPLFNLKLCGLETSGQRPSSFFKKIILELHEN